MIHWLINHLIKECGEGISPGCRQNLHQAIYLTEDIRQQWLFLRDGDATTSHHRFQGIPNKNETILLYHQASLPGRWYGYRSEYIKYPSDDAEPRRELAMITSVAIIDHMKNGTEVEMVEKLKLWVVVLVRERLL